MLESYLVAGIRYRYYHTVSRIKALVWKIQEEEVRLQTNKLKARCWQHITKFSIGTK